MLEKEMLAWLRNYQGPSLRLMEVCGTHTSALYRTGLRQMLPKEITLLSGPGCPVCVTPSAYIDKLVEYSFMANCRVLTFADMLRVPGSRLSLAQAKAQGGQVDFFYTPEQALELAQQEPDTLFIVAAVGFETTAPIWANIVLQAAEKQITNLKLLTAIKTMPQAISSLCERGDIDGFLCPGHVAVITGNGPFRELAEQYQKTMVVGGFEGQQLLKALVRLVWESSRNKAGLWNEYTSVVAEAGNEKAKAILAKVLKPGAAVWRGLGVLDKSGLFLREEYQAWDAGSFDLTEDKLPRGCQCNNILLGKLTPGQCPCFGKACTPEHPVGACMVSSEGTCCITYREGIE